MYGGTVPIILAPVIAIGVAVLDIRGHIDEVIFDRFEKLEKSISELKQLIDRLN